MVVIGGETGSPNWGTTRSRFYVPNRRRVDRRVLTPQTLLREVAASPPGQKILQKLLRDLRGLRPPGS